jgi:hypothetical protein
MHNNRSKLTQDIHYKDAGVFETWKDLYKKFDELCNEKSGHNWVFRGQSAGCIGLKTSLERFVGYIASDEIQKVKGVFKRLKVRWDRKCCINWLELGLLRRFQRQYHHYAKAYPMPDDDNVIDWFSIMQHYKTPTRLLDWTYSFNVAVFFAVEDVESSCRPERKKPEFSEVWAADLSWLVEKLHGAFPDNEEILEKVDRNLCNIKNFKKYNGQLTVIPVTPYFLHERLTIQQGFFLMPGNITESFEDNLIALGKNNNQLKANLLKFRIRNNLRAKCDIVKRLHRMNINRATLFPGLDGFGASLGNFLFFMPDVLIPGSLYYKIYEAKKYKFLINELKNGKNNIRH